jgi:alkylhydroperoxidase/carboxymuconolactone decarboxylase family protein YurZ
MTVTPQDIRAEALRLLAGVPDGDGLDPAAVALLRVAVHAAVTALDVDGIDGSIRAALASGATPAQVHETLVLMSGLGVHTLMEGSRRLAGILAEHGDAPGPLDDERAALRDRRQGGHSYWAAFEREVPGFLDALLRLSPTAYDAFFAYCAVPWRTRELPAVTKELMAVASNATPTHRYVPGLRIHLANAVALGAGRTAVLHTLDIAATAPHHDGVGAAYPSRP